MTEMQTKQNARAAYRLHDRKAHQNPVSGEPDLIRWAEVPVPWDRAGVFCEIIRDTQRGYFCGYVHVRPGHPWYGVEANNLPDEAHDASHGGISLATSYGLIGWDANHLHDRSPWCDPDGDGGSDYRMDGHYVSAAAAEHHTRALARLALAAMYETDSPAEVTHDDA